MNILKAAGLALMLGGLTSPSLADEPLMITLKSLDGTVVIKGELQAFDGGYYHLVVVGVGLVRVAQELVECQSANAECTALISTS